MKKGKTQNQESSQKLKLGLLGVKNRTVVTRAINKTISQFLNRQFQTETIKGIWIL